MGMRVVAVLGMKLWWSLPINIVSQVSHHVRGICVMWLIWRHGIEVELKSATPTIIPWRINKNNHTHIQTMANFLSIITWFSLAYSRQTFSDYVYITWLFCFLHILYINPLPARIQVAAVMQTIVWYWSLFLYQHRLSNEPVSPAAGRWW